MILPYGGLNDASSPNRILGIIRGRSSTTMPSWNPTHRGIAYRSGREVRLSGQATLTAEIERLQCEVEQKGTRDTKSRMCA